MDACRRAGSALALTLVVFFVPFAMSPLPPARAAARVDAPGAGFVPIDELARGDRCVGRTVFTGTEIEEFELEILGVVRGTAPGSDLIIGRAEGPILEHTGIMEGMSGSPVYKDGRLVGAIASAWQFSKEPIAGITPIGEMLEALEHLDRDEQSSVPTGAGGFAALDLLPEGERASSSLARLADQVGALPPGSAAPGGQAGRTGPAYDGRSMIPISVPLVVSGATDGFLRRASELLGSGLTPLPGAGGLSPAAGATGGGKSAAGGQPASGADPVENDAALLEPGAAVGVQFVRGDVNWTAIGTVTHREGDRLIAFGHPLFNSGSIDMPLVGAYVHTVMPIQSTSFKYASGGELLGAVKEDRNRAVAGIVGARPEMVPLTATIRLDGGDARSFDFEVARGRPYTSIFSGLAFGGAVSSAAKASGPVTVELAAKIDTGGDLVSYRDVFSTSDPAMRCSGELSLLLSVLEQNSFEERPVRGVELDVNIREGVLATSIVRVDADRKVYRPGDEVRLRVFLRPVRGEPFDRELTLRLPDSTPTGAVVLRVGDGLSYHLWENDRLGGGAVPRSYDQLLALIRQSKPGNLVVAQLLSESPGISLSGVEMRGVPGKAGLAMASSATGGAVDASALTVLAEDEFAVDGQASGFLEVSLYVENK
jgi:hypothetical protein